MDPATWADAKAPDPVFQQDPSRDVLGTGHGSFFRSFTGRFVSDEIRLEAVS